MNYKKLIDTFALVVLIVGMLAVGSAIAQTTAVGPYYATPSWDQTLSSSTRFIVLSNMGSAAVLDRETGVVWERSPGTMKHSAIGGFDLADSPLLHQASKNSLKNFRQKEQTE